MKPRITIITIHSPLLEISGADAYTDIPPVQTCMAWGILSKGLNKKGYHLDERIRSPNLDRAPLATSPALGAVGKVRFGKANMQLLAICDRTMLATGKIR